MQTHTAAALCLELRLIYTFASVSTSTHLKHPSSLFDVSITLVHDIRRIFIAYHRSTVTFKFQRFHHIQPYHHIHQWESVFIAPIGSIVEDIGNPPFINMRDLGQRDTLLIHHVFLHFITILPYPPIVVLPSPSEVDPALAIVYFYSHSAVLVICVINFRLIIGIFLGLVRCLVA
ncbi:hypothetical protein FRC20_002456 [Serendipita sp. 405]|nr:hypothetical protein FRC20_002456 [Serendipita sp. 405]